jgi:AmmeMemoRadiSam system protein B
VKREPDVENVRPPAVAGTFYPDDPDRLRASVRGYLEEAPERREPAPKGLIVPHAGYVYSGPVAATAYRALEPVRAQVRRIVLLGPSHRIPLRGLAVPTCDSFDTPLGRVPVARDTLKLVEWPQILEMDAAHDQEHSLEVQLPFLQETLGDFELVPLAVGEADPEEVAEVVGGLWDGPGTRIVISSDLSHYHDYETARRLDAATADAVEQLREEDIDYDQACGAAGIRGLLVVARRLGLSVETVDLRSSGDTAGSRSEVVGYGSFLFFEREGRAA